jgi:hypothetical protein
VGGGAGERGPRAADRVRTRGLHAAAVWMRGLIESSSLEARSRMRRSLKQLMRTDVSCGVSQALPACADTTCFKRAACISSRCLR